MDIIEYNRIIQNNYLVVFFFYSDDYSVLLENIDKLKVKYNTIYMVNVEDKNNKEIIEELFITSCPLFRIYKNHVLIEEIFGNYSNILRIIEGHF